MLKPGDKLLCTLSSNIDKTTKGKVYTVAFVSVGGFKIYGDDGKISFPIESNFKKVD